MALGTILILTGMSVWATGSTDQQGAATGVVPEIEVLDFYEFVPNATSETFLFAELSQRLNATVVPVHVPRSDFDTKISLILASGDLPDIIRTLGTLGAELPNQYGPQGVFVNVTEATRNGSMPNLAKIVSEFPWALTTAPDGNAYQTPRLNMWNQTYNQIVLRGKALERAGYNLAQIESRTNTPDGLLEVILDLQTQLSEEAGHKVSMIGHRSSRGLGYIMEPIANNFGTSLRMYYTPDGTYEWGPSTQNYREMLEFSNGLHVNQVFHPSWVTMREEEHKALMWQRYEGGVWFNGGHGSFENWGKADPANAYTGEIDLRVKPPVVNGELPRMRARSRISGGWVLPADNPDLDKALEVQDYFYDVGPGGGAELVSFGNEAYHFRYDASHPAGYVWLKNYAGFYPASELLADPERKETRGSGITVELARVVPRTAWGESTLTIYYDPADSDFLTRFADKKATDAWVNWGLFVEEPEPILDFTAEENEERLDIEARLATFVDEESTKFIIGLRSLGTWGDFEQRLESLGAGRLEEIYNQAAARVR
jgi:putative aldouronate transport system substrate-binding protein